MIRAVFWDFGGVLTTSPFDAFRRFERENGLPRDFIRTVNATNPESNAWAQFESSRIDLDEFDRRFEEESRAAGHPVRGRRVIELLGGDLRVEMVAALRRIASRFTNACLTNNVLAGEGPGMQGSPEKAAAVAEVMRLFDVVIESSRIGVRKPEPRFYEIACESAGVAPEQVVFLDDLGINLKPARAMGMATIKVADPDAALAELEQVLGMTLREPVS
ncbi:MAG TPA: HAD-IA family hydrolase [Gammaproteobacteria bacterium]|nr:HAD-IA family hydrolase [Gammaproteobacteria bacterium]